MKVLEINNDYKHAYTLFMDQEMESIFINQSNLKSVMCALISGEKFNEAVFTFNSYLDRNGLNYLSKNVGGRDNFLKGFLYFTKALYRLVSV